MEVRCKYDELVLIHKLNLNPKNRNVHSEEQVIRLAQILEYQGWRYPVKISKQSGLVTSGHGRVLAAIYNKWLEVPVNYQDYEDAEQEYADTVADNAIANWAELDLTGVKFDIGTLSTEFKPIYLGIQDFNLAPPKEVTPDDLDLSEQWIVTIKCTDEEDMQKVYEEMNERGYECKLIT